MDRNISDDSKWPKIEEQYLFAEPRFPDKDSPPVGRAHAAPNVTDGALTLPNVIVSLTRKVAIVLSGPPSPYARLSGIDKLVKCVAEGVYCGMASAEKTE